MPDIKKRIAIYPGSFDPFTLGHFDILERALGLFDEVRVVIAKSSSKKSLLSFEERKDLIEKIFSADQRVTVVAWEGLLVEYARKKKIPYIVRGLRPTGDFEGEYQMASMNSKLHPEVETLFLMTSSEHNFISSSLVKEIWSHQGDISEFVPADVLLYLQKRES